MGKLNKNIAKLRESSKDGIKLKELEFTASKENCFLDLMKYFKPDQIPKEITVSISQPIWMGFLGM